MFFLKYLLKQSKNKDSGFMIPLILGFGLFMLAIGLTSIKMSSNSEVSSKLQKRTQQAVAAAEMGVGRIQALMDANRTIAVYNDCVSRDETSGECDPNSGASWANATKIVIPPAQSNSCKSSSVAGTSQLIDLAQSLEWENADPSDSSKGQYRLISYTYTPDPGVSQFDTPGVGILEVEGRTNQFESTATNPDDEVMNTGTTRLRVEIPIKKSTKTTPFSQPGLWMKFNVNADMDLQKVKGSILLEDKTCGGGGNPPVNITEADNIVANSGTLSTTPIAMPSTPDLPPNNSLYEITGDDVLPKNKASAGESLPRTGDLPYQGAYHYLVPELGANGGGDFNIKSDQKVVLYVQGPIKIGGSINKDSNLTPENLTIYGNTTVTGNSGRDNTNFKYGCDLSDKSQCPTKILDLSGTADIDAFILAPEAWGCLNGGGKPSATDPVITGFLWINQWMGDKITGAPSGLTCTGKDQVVIDTINPTTGEPWPLPDSVTSSLQDLVTVTPQLAPTTSWEKLERE